MRALVVALLLTAAIPALPVPADTFYRLDLENAHLTEDRLVEGWRSFRIRREGGALRPEIVPLPPRTGGGHALDLSSATTTPGARADRAEITITSGIHFGDRWFLGLRVFIPEGVPDPKTWHLFMQCHQAGTATPPPLSLNLTHDGAIALVTRGTRDPYRVLWSTAATRGVWHRIVLAFEMEEAGRIRLWYAGTEVLSSNDLSVWRGGEARCTLKAGLYRGPSPDPFRMILDDVALGTDYRSVAPPTRTD